MDGPSRRAFLRSGGIIVASGIAGCGGRPSRTPDTTAPPTEPSTATIATATEPSTATTATATEPSTAETSTPTPVEQIGLEPLIQGLEAPVAMAFMPDSANRYVLEQSGLVLHLGPDGLADEPALDLRATVATGYEMGLLGIALHPAFDDNRRLYLRYSAPARAGTPNAYSHTFILAEFTATEDGSVIKPGSERTLLEIPEPQPNHNAGDIAFGPDGYLYVPVGDGGGGGDSGGGHVDDWYDGVGGGNGQDVTENLLGSLLRIDVDARDGDRPYGIPDDNPLVGREGHDEHYAWGLRNPWRLAFDDGELYVGDVGQRRFEEVDLVERGGNYGWNVKEGAHCFGANDCPDRTPAGVRGGEPLIDPIIEYPTDGSVEAPISGVAIIGGNVYRGDSMVGLKGTYIFGDLQADGTLFAANRPESEGLWPTRTMPIVDDDTDRLSQLFSFARDQGGELYVLGVGKPGGGVYRLVPAS